MVDRAIRVFDYSVAGNLFFGREFGFGDTEARSVAFFVTDWGFAVFVFLEWEVTDVVFFVFPRTVFELILFWAKPSLEKILVARFGPKTVFAFFWRIFPETNIVPQSSPGKVVWADGHGLMLPCSETHSETRHGLRVTGHPLSRF